MACTTNPRKSRFPLPISITRNNRKRLGRYQDLGPGPGHSRICFICYWPSLEASLKAGLPGACLAHPRLKLFLANCGTPPLPPPLFPPPLLAPGHKSPELFLGDGGGGSNSRRHLLVCCFLLQGRCFDPLSIPGTSALPCAMTPWATNRNQRRCLWRSKARPLVGKAWTAGANQPLERPACLLWPGLRPVGCVGGRPGWRPLVGFWRLPGGGVGCVSVRGRTCCEGGFAECGP